MGANQMKCLGDLWCITPEALETIAGEIYRQGDPVAGLSGSNGCESSMPVDNGIAVIKVSGALSGYSYDTIRRQVAEAIASPDVRALVLRINSPGGMVAGCKELADFIGRAGKAKAVYAYADGTMCSAAYWIGSAAREIAAPVTASIGSIGVRTLHIDWSRWNEKAGLSFTHIAAGEYKALGNEDEPLSDKARGYIQERLDTLYSIFAAAVSANRGIAPDRMSGVAEGRVFLAGDARAKGLIDRVEDDFESYLGHILSKERIMDLMTLKETHPDLYARALDEGKQQAAAEAAESARAETARETDRILGIAGVMLDPDMAASFEAVVKSGADATVAASLKQAFSAPAVTNGAVINGTVTNGSVNNGSANGSGAESDSRRRILEGLANAHSNGVGQERGSEGSNRAADFEKQANALADLANRQARG